MELYIHRVFIILFYNFIYIESIPSLIVSYNISPSINVNK
jgi:hypothetical protein